MNADGQNEILFATGTATGMYILPGNQSASYSDPLCTQSDPGIIYWTDNSYGPIKLAKGIGNINSDIFNSPDAYDDVAVTNSAANNNSGIVIVLLGSDPITGTSDIGAQYQGAIIHGGLPNINAGHYVLGLNLLDSDITPDFAIGAPAFSSNGTLPGAVYIVLGSTTLFPVGQVKTWDLQQLGASVIKIVGEDGDEFGTSFAIGDLTDASVNDLVVGAPGAANGRGRVYVVYARNGFWSAPVSTFPDVAIIEGDEGEGLGAAVSVSDINGDGVDDILMGTRTGSCRIIFGVVQPTPSASISEASTLSPASQFYLHTRSGLTIGFSSLSLCSSKADAAHKATRTPNKPTEKKSTTTSKPVSNPEKDDSSSSASGLLGFSSSRTTAVATSLGTLWLLLFFFRYF